MKRAFVMALIVVFLASAPLAIRAQMGQGGAGETTTVEKGAAKKHHHKKKHHKKAKAQKKKADAQQS